ncbi:MAG: FIST signal transduction protein [Thermoplasmatota archaeon]
MKTSQHRWSPKGWEPPLDSMNADVVLVFGSPEAMREAQPWADLKATYAGAHTFGCSTAGEIADTEVTDGDMVATAVKFASTKIQIASALVQPGEDSEVVGRRLAASLPAQGLRHVLVLSDGQRVNGSKLASGLRAGLPPEVAVTGGLAGDGARFEHTLVVADGPPVEGRVAVMGLYGDRVHVGFGSLGGWDSFGPSRRVTSSKGNVLYELDGQPALALYKKYLGEDAKKLPATGLLYPLSVQMEGSPRELVRTILGVDEASQSLTFAGDIPQGSHARLMKANFDRLVDGAMGAARACSDSLGDAPSELALLISCVGRKLVLKQRIEEEVEAVRETLGPKPVMTGFYSYGEICPSAPNASCELHNQTMTITTIRED